MNPFQGLRFTLSVHQYCSGLRVYAVGTLAQASSNYPLLLSLPPSRFAPGSSCGSCKARGFSDAL